MKSLYRNMYLIRRFEERILELFSEGKLSGTTHTCIGQEIIPVLISEQLQPQDIIWSNHRGHGHYLARTGDVKGLLAEIMGLPEGICGGRGGSQHLCRGQFFSNGILGSTAPIAAGMALVEKLRKSKAIVVLYLGDGAMGEGVVYETLNMISLWKLPILIVIENNHYAQTTHELQNRAGNLRDRIRSFGIFYEEIERNFDVGNTRKLLKTIVGMIRLGNMPAAFIFDTYRFSPHSKGDDYRSKRDLEIQWENDPLLWVRGLLDKTTVDQIETNVDWELKAVENEVCGIN